MTLGLFAGLACLLEQRACRASGGRLVRREMTQPPPQALGDFEGKSNLSWGL